MENRVLLAHSGYGVLATSPQQSRCGVPVGLERFVALPLGKRQHWHFRVEKKVTRRPSRKNNMVDVQATKSGIGFKLPGTLKLKSEGPTSDSTSPKSGTEKLGKLPGTLKLPGMGRVAPKDKNVVFVAGATGKVGRRVVRELVQLGYSVRAGVRDVDRAQFLLEFTEGGEGNEETEAAMENRPTLWSNFSPEKLFSFLGSTKKKSRVKLVEFDLEKSEMENIEAALGNAAVVVCAIGASEKEALNVTAPYRIDFKATENLINAAISAQVNHFVLVTSLGTSKVGWPAAILNLFWGVLIWKAKAENALIESGIPFTIVRPGGMEKPTDAYKETHNLLLDEADSRFGGQVSSLQVAELIAGIVSNLELAQDKVLEVVAETTAPLRTIEDLLVEIPSISTTKTEEEDDRKAVTAGKKTKDEVTFVRQKAAKATKQREQEEKITNQQAAKAAKQRDKEERLAAEQENREALWQKLQIQYMEAKQKEQEASKEAAAARLEKEEIEKEAAELRSRAEAATQAAREAKALEVAIIAAAREAKKLTDKDKEDIVASVRAEIEAEVKAKQAKERAIIDPKEVKSAKAQEVAKAAQAAEQKRKADAVKGAAEAEQLAKAEEEKLKAEAETKAREEAEEIAKAEAEKKAKTEAEKKAKAVEEEKAKAEAKREAEIKARADAEEQAKAEAEAEAEAKAKAKADQKLKVEAEKRANEDEEEKRKAEARVTKPAPQEGESNVVEVIASGVVFQRKQASKPFSWPWQKEEPLEEYDCVTDYTVNESPVVPVEPEKGRDRTSTRSSPSRSLSPYAQYPGLKPPRFPSVPPPPPPKVEDKVAGLAAEVVEIGTGQVDELQALEDGATTILVKDEDNLNSKEAEAAEGKWQQELATKAVLEIKAREQAAIEKAKSSATFSWPWQKSKPASETKASNSNPPNILDQAAKRQVAASSATTERPREQEVPRSSGPLSPYARYPGLKPPTSPTPLHPRSATSNAKESSQTNGFADLETPSSTLSSLPLSSPEEVKSSALAAAEAADRAEEFFQRAKAASAGTFLWPWQKREPEPTAVPLAQGKPDLASTDLPRTPRPLSPYSRYPGLKPPTSPTPSAPNITV